MQIECFEFNMFGENTYIVFDTTSHECAIIDPGMMVERERSIIDNFIKKNCLKPKFILLTHLHVDHVFGVSHLVEKYGLKVYGNLADAMLGSRIMEQVQMFHLPVQMAAIAIDENLSDGDKVNIGDETLLAIHAPGHSPGSLCYYSEKSGFVISGDVLFRHSIGRTDLPGGDYQTLIKSIQKGLLTLPDKTTVLPGHGPKTTISEENQFNPYITYIC